MRNFWRQLITVPNAVALSFFLIGVGGWWQDQRAFREHTVSEVGRLDSKIDAKIGRVEQRLDVKDAKDVENAVSRAEMTLKLVQISNDINSLRDEVKDVKTEVRKIR